MKSKIKYPATGGEITRVEFSIAISKARGILSLQLEDEDSPVLMQYIVRDGGIPLDKTIRSQIDLAVSRGIENTSPSNPGYIWNILLEIERRLYPGILRDLKYETKPVPDVKGRIY